MERGQVFAQEQNRIPNVWEILATTRRYAQSWKTCLTDSCLSCWNFKHQIRDPMGMVMVFLGRIRKALPLGHLPAISCNTFSANPVSIFKGSTQDGVMTADQDFSPSLEDPKEATKAATLCKITRPRRACNMDVFIEAISLLETMFLLCPL